MSSPVLGAGVSWAAYSFGSSPPMRSTFPGTQCRSLGLVRSCLVKVFFVYPGLSLSFLIRETYLDLASSKVGKFGSSVVTVSLFMTHFTPSLACSDYLITRSGCPALVGGLFLGVTA